MNIRVALCLLTFASYVLAAIDGTVINGSTGKPQPSVTISTRPARREWDAGHRQQHHRRLRQVQHRS